MPLSPRTTARLPGTLPTRTSAHVPDADLAALYSGAAIFVFPSLYEGFGLPVLEAMQCGTPVITTNVSAMPEVAGNAAITVDPTEEALHDAMVRLLENPTLAADVGRQCLERASAFSWSRTADEMLAVYRRISSTPLPQSNDSR